MWIRLVKITNNCCVIANQLLKIGFTKHIEWCNSNQLRMTSKQLNGLNGSANVCHCGINVGNRPFIIGVSGGTSSGKVRWLIGISDKFAAHFSRST